MTKLCARGRDIFRSVRDSQHGSRRIQTVVYAPSAIAKGINQDTINQKTP
jgi:hypothetical protein